MLLTHLPARVMIAAAASGAPVASRTVAEGIAGLDAIAAGRASSSDLVRAVAATIYAEPDRDRPAAEQVPAAPLAGAQVLAECRAASTVLRARARPVDSAAYRHWLETIAARVCGASRNGKISCVAGVRARAAEHQFLAALSAALRA
jgi:hypothetical protein